MNKSVFGFEKFRSMHETAHFEGPLAYFMHQISIQLGLFQKILALVCVRVLECAFQYAYLFFIHFIYFYALALSDEDVQSSQEDFADFLPCDFLRGERWLDQHRGELEHIERKHGRKNHLLNCNELIFVYRSEYLLGIFLDTSNLVRAHELQFLRALHARQSLTNINHVNGKIKVFEFCNFIQAACEAHQHWVFANFQPFCHIYSN